MAHSSAGAKQTLFGDRGEDPSSSSSDGRKNSTADAIFRYAGKRAAKALWTFEDDVRCPNEMLGRLWLKESAYQLHLLGGAR